MKYILAAARAQSFTRAAQRLGISQPSLSASVKSVEEAVGTPLFERGTNPIRLTEAGVLYVETAQKIERLQQEFERHLHDRVSCGRQRLVLGGGSYVSSYILPPLLQRFTAKYPQIAVELVQSDSRTLRSALWEEEIDLAIDSYAFSGNGLLRTTLCREELLLAVPNAFLPTGGQEGIRPTELYAHRRAITELPAQPLSAFAQVPFVLLKEGHDMRRRAEALFTQCAFVPKTRYCVDQLMTSFTMTLSQMGASFVTDTLFTLCRYEDTVTLYRLQGQGTAREYSILQKKGRAQTEAMSAFLSMAL